MQQTVDLYTFRRAFEQTRPDNFSYEGLAVLFDYLEQLEDDLGEELELDVIAICCDYSEDDPENIASGYSIDLTDCEDYADKHLAVKEWLQENGAYVGETADSLLYNVNF